jgi:hypothetical protein
VSTGLVWLRIKKREGSCECGNEISGSIKCCETTEWPRTAVNSSSAQYLHFRKLLMSPNAGNYREAAQVVASRAVLSSTELVS